MGKKVTVISTSLRHGSNSAVLADAFAMGASEAGNEVTLISLTGRTSISAQAALPARRRESASSMTI